jgi:hypothetical protein
MSCPRLILSLFGGQPSYERGKMLKLHHLSSEPGRGPHEGSTRRPYALLIILIYFWARTASIHVYFKQIEKLPIVAMNDFKGWAS